MQGIDLLGYRVTRPLRHHPLGQPKQAKEGLLKQHVAFDIASDVDSGDSLLNPFIWLSVPLLRHENPARLLLQHLH